MKKLDTKKLMILGIGVLVILAILAIVITSLKAKKSQEKNVSKNEIENDVDGTFEPSNGYESYDIPLEDMSVSEVKSFLTYADINNCISKYHRLLADVYASEHPVNPLEIASGERRDVTDTIEKLCDVLDPQYIDYYRVNKGNLKSTVNYGDYDFFIDELYSKMEENGHITDYLAIGKLKNRDEQISSYSYIVRIDTSKGVYSIIPNNYISAKKVGKNNLETIAIRELNETENNKKEANTKNDGKYAIMLFTDYKNRMLYDKSKGYSMLDSEYSAARFEDYNDYVSYINNNKDKIMVSAVQKYNTSNKGDKFVVEIIDQNYNYYLFEAESPSNYKVKLDKYSIEDSEYIREYNNKDAEGKVKVIVEKINYMMNIDNYYFLYNKLNPVFRENNIPSKEYLQTIVEANIYDQSNIIIDSIEKQGDTYIVKAAAENKKDEELEKRSISFFIRLKEGTDFEYSLSV